MPDAGLMGTINPVIDNAKKTTAFLLVGCEMRGSQKVPVIRFTLPSASLSAIDLPSAPLAGHVPAAARPLRTGEYGIRGNRALYAVARGGMSVMVQYDSDPREVAELASPRPEGNQLVEFFLKDSIITFSLPAPNGALLQVLSACNVAPWSSDAPEGSVLSPQFIEAAVYAVQAIKAKRFASGQPATLDAATSLDDVAITAAEDQVRVFIQGGFLPVCAAEKGVPPRRAKCADDLVTAIKAGSASPRCCTEAPHPAPTFRKRRLSKGAQRS